MSTRTRTILRLVRYSVFLVTMFAWVGSGSGRLQARMNDTCTDPSDCEPHGQVCVDGYCVDCENDPGQCNEFGKVCQATGHCAYGDCDPYDVSDSDCYPYTCQPLDLYCYYCGDNPTQCPNTTWCDWGESGQCVPIPR